ncbi:MAG: hypothetical protein IKG40_02555 [Bacilli bacterium]|nr:hypothetical protein [Bacilli bacterium]
MKRNLLKAIGISFLFFVVLTWIIPVGTYASGKLKTSGVDAVGLFDLIGVPVNSFVTFALFVAVFMVIGGLYGVMKKTGALDAWTDKVSNKYNGKEKRFLVFTVILFVLLSSLTGLTLALFVLVPLFAMILSKLNYDKVTALAATVGGILVGSMGSTYGFNISGYTKNILTLNMNFQIVPKIIILVLLTAALLFFVLKYAERKTTTKEVREVKEEKKEEVVKKIENKTAKKTSSSKNTRKPNKKGRSTTKNMAVSSDVKKVKNEKGVSTAPLAIIFVLMVIITIVGMYNWYYSFEINLFNDMHEAIMGVDIKGFKIFEHLFSGMNALGYWGNNEFIIVMVIAAALIAFIYRLSFNDFVEGFIAGIKRMMPTAIYAALASVILAVLYQASYQGAGTMVDTMFNKTMTLTKGFNVLTAGGTALYGSFFYNDLYYLLYSLQAYISEFSKHSIAIAGLLVQSMYGLGMMLFPTSVILIAGLSYYDVSYKKWFKYIWKFALIALLVIFIVCAIAAAL